MVDENISSSYINMGFENNKKRGRFVTSAPSAPLGLTIRGIGLTSFINGTEEARPPRILC
jgi:hypothetical protein